MNGPQDTTGTDLELNYITVPVWPDEDDNSTQLGVKLFKGVGQTAKLLANSFTSVVSNTVRMTMEGQVWGTKYYSHSLSQYGQVLKSRMTAATKSRDRQLTQLQTLMLDAAGPITHILEEAGLMGS